MKKFIFGFYEGKNVDHMGREYFVGIAISQDGTILNFCQSLSHAGMIYDLGMDGLSTCGHKIYDEYYPAGWEAEYVTTRKFKNHGLLQNAISLCQQKKKLGLQYRYQYKGKILTNTLN